MLGWHVYWLGVITTASVVVFRFFCTVFENHDIHLTRR